MNDPRSVLQSLGIECAPPGHYHVTGEWVGCDCPNCSPGTGKFKLGLKFPTAASCWTCGPTKLWDFLKSATGKSYGELKEAFRGCYFDDRPDTGPDSSKNGPRKRYLPPPGVKPLLRAHRAYIRSRGLSVAECRKWGIQGIGPDGGYLAWRLFLPIRCGWEVVSYTTRSINPDEPRRYISASAEEESVPHKTLLYGAELATHAIVINEGPLEAISLGPGGVATCGVVVSSAQLEKMAHFPVRVVVANNEPVAIDRAARLVADLEVFDGKTYLVVPSGKDLLSSPKAEREKLIRRFLA